MGYRNFHQGNGEKTLKNVERGLFAIKNFLFDLALMVFS